jgi:thiol:disulfide interchange protein DsbC
MDITMKSFERAALAALLALAVVAAPAQAQEAAIRKNLPERLPQLGKIDEVSKTPMPGLYEVRVGTELFYTDADGSYLLQGHLIDTKLQRNLTEERLDKLTAIDFAALPMKDAFTVVRGNGKRRIAVFEDPNCTYCRSFERELQKVDNVTVHMFLYPILGPDSAEKSRSIWCAADKGKTWQDWMLQGKPLARASCDTAAVARNVEFGKKYKITGTPTIVFTDGTRVPGAIGAAEVEKLITAAQAK